MAIKCGFFNSINQDRLYQANDMTRPYELLVSNGVFATQEGTPSNYLQVFSNEGLTVTVKAGRGIFADKWFISDADLPLTLDAAEVTLPRIDTIVVKIDLTDSVRAGFIEIKKGTPASVPVAPAVTRTDLIKEYRLADITVAPQTTAIIQRNISDARSGSECGWVTSLVQQVDTSTLWNQWQAAFDAWFEELHETVATQTLIRSFTSRYVTLTQDETVIPIEISEFNSELDILQVYINGLILVKNVDYTIAAGEHENITLVNGVDTGTQISFVVYKSVDGSEAETVVSLVYELQDELDASRVTGPTGTVKSNVTSGSILTAFETLGMGTHTLFSSTTATDSPRDGTSFRYIGTITSSVAPHNGWLMGYGSDGSLYINTLNLGVWRGWRGIYIPNPSALYRSETGSFPNGGVTITPSKPLSECDNGWVMIWTGFDDDLDQGRDVYTQTVVIPKKSYKNADWNGESMTFPLVYHYNDATEAISQCVKTMFIYNDRLVSGTNNSLGNNRNMVIRAIYEY